MTFEQIRAVILGRMQSFDGIEQSRIDYQLPARRFAPPSEGIWCRLNIRYGPSFMAGMANTPYTRKIGLIVFQCFDKAFVETVGLVRLTDKIESHFGYWMQGDLETLETSVVDIGVDPAGFYQKNVNVRFRAG